jgi:hypothetical protein
VVRLAWRDGTEGDDGDAWSMGHTPGDHVGKRHTVTVASSPSHRGLAHHALRREGLGAPHTSLTQTCGRDYKSEPWVLRPYAARGKAYSGSW